MTNTTNKNTDKKNDLPEGQYVDPNQDEIDRIQRETEEKNKEFNEQRLKENRKRDRDEK